MTRLGVIAEDKSDFDTLVAIVSRAYPNRFIFRKALGKGCGKIRSRCQKFSRLLHDRGCEALIILHDADGNDEPNLRKVLEQVSSPNPIRDRVVVIPIQTIEAWLLSDIAAVAHVFSRSNNPLKEYSDPQRFSDPKRRMKQLVKQKFQKDYLNTVHNRKIAEHVDLNKVMKCSSVRPLVNFLNNH